MRRPLRPSTDSFALVAVLALCAAPAAAGVRVVGPEEVLARHCQWKSGLVWLTVPNLAPQELVTSIADPAVVNDGDGAFHPFDVAHVEAALASLAFPTDRLDVVVYVLPFPRRAGLESAALPGAILLAPGTLPVPSATAHAVVAHEFGHVIQYALAPEGSAAWARYMQMRGLAGNPRYSEFAAHADRPREIFAEDVRAVLG